MQVRRLKKLADTLDRAQPARFNMSEITCWQPAHRTDYDSWVALCALGSELPKLLTESRCGAAGCAIGYAPLAFPRDLMWTRSGSITFRERSRYWQGSTDPAPASFKVMSIFLDLDGPQLDWLFEAQNNYLAFFDDMDEVTPQFVADRIRRFIKVKGNVCAAIKLETTIIPLRPPHDAVWLLCDA